MVSLTDLVTLQAIIEKDIMVKGHEHQSKLAQDHAKVTKKIKEIRESILEVLD